LIFGKVALE